MKQSPGAMGCVQDPLSQIASSHETPLLVHEEPSVFGVVLHPPVPSHVELAWQSVGVHV